MNVELTPLFPLAFARTKVCLLPKIMLEKVKLNVLTADAIFTPSDALKVMVPDVVVAESSD